MLKNICDSLGKFGSVNSIFLHLGMEWHHNRQSNIVNDMLITPMEYLKENLINLI